MSFLDASNKRRAKLLTKKANCRMSTTFKYSLSFAKRAKLRKLDQVAVATVSVNASHSENASSPAEMFHKLCVRVCAVTHSHKREAHFINFRSPATRPRALSLTFRVRRQMNFNIFFPSSFVIPLNDIDGRIRIGIIGTHCHRWVSVHPITVVGFQRNHGRMLLIAQPLSVCNAPDEIYERTDHQQPEQSAIHTHIKRKCQLRFFIRPVLPRGLVVRRHDTPTRRCEFSS